MPTVPITGWLSLLEFSLFHFNLYAYALPNNQLVINRQAA